MSMFSIIAENGETTVVTEYVPEKRKSDNYQSEAELENELIRMLCEQGYERLNIHTEDDLVENLKNQLVYIDGYDSFVGEMQSRADEQKVFSIFACKAFISVVLPIPFAPYKTFIFPSSICIVPFVMDATFLSVIFIFKPSFLLVVNQTMIIFGIRLGEFVS